MSALQIGIIGWGKLKEDVKFLEEKGYGRLVDGSTTEATLEIYGPADSPYEGYAFEVKVKSIEEYPYVAPELECITKIFHANINNKGLVCINYDIDNSENLIIDLIEGLIDCLRQPSKDMINADAMFMYLGNAEKYNARAKECARQFAKKIEKAATGVEESVHEPCDKEILHSNEAINKSLVLFVICLVYLMFFVFHFFFTFKFGARIFFFFLVFVFFSFAFVKNILQQQKNGLHNSP